LTVDLAHRGSGLSGCGERRQPGPDFAVLNGCERRRRPAREHVDRENVLVTCARGGLEVDLSGEPLVCDVADGDLRSVRVDIAARADGHHDGVEPLLGVDFAREMASMLASVRVVVPGTPTQPRTVAVIRQSPSICGGGRPTILDAGHGRLPFSLLPTVFERSDTRTSWFGPASGERKAVAAAVDRFAVRRGRTKPRPGSAPGGVDTTIEYQQANPIKNHN
jgi:hypothetical protein